MQYLLNLKLRLLAIEKHETRLTFYMYFMRMRKTLITKRKFFRKSRYSLSIEVGWRRTQNTRSHSLSVSAQLRCRCKRSEERRFEVFGHKTKKNIRIFWFHYNIFQITLIWNGFASRGERNRERTRTDAYASTCVSRPRNYTEVLFNNISFEFIKSDFQ